MNSRLVTIAILLSLSILVQSHPTKAVQRPQHSRQPAATALNTSQEIEVPSDLIKQLSRDDREVANFLNQGLGNDPMYKFTGTSVDLNGDGKPEFIIYPPVSMDGNSSGPRWVYRRTRLAYEQLLSTGAMNIEALKSSSEGYRDIQTSGGGNSGGYFKSIFKFNGKKYVLYATKKSKVGVPK